MIKQCATEPFNWLDVTDLDQNDKRMLLKHHQLDPLSIEYATDRHERAHYINDLDQQTSMIIFNLPLPKSAAANQQQPMHFTISPLTFIVKEGDLFTFHNPQFNLLISQLKQLLSQHHNWTSPKFVLEALFAGTQYYDEVIEQLNDQRSNLVDNLDQKIQNQDLLALAEIEKSFVYILSGTQTNLMLLEKIAQAKETGKAKRVEHKAIIKLLIEARQAEQMAKISLDVTERLTATSNNLLNNNLNDTMKFLTVWSLVLTIPTIVTGFYGMNVFLPLAKYSLAWILIIVLTVILMLILWYYLKKHRFI
ncbi:magnesium transporter CorA family protein [Liquorilactobacillus sicerae]|uniref:magnesium transporter CorA family protein n=1 Tax=Liquorilactobacillus sicerae TaxID=1416943 RepID=UPI0024802895|nr:magnesium transporter CorA family protein [Liquorilactobacillus sicerae]